MGGRLIRGIAAAAFCLCAAAANAQTYPNKPIRLVVGFPPGGGIDIVARLVGAKMQEALKVPFVVDNRAGATGLLATEVVAKSAPDGYTLLVAASAQMTMNPVLYSNLPYDTFKDFAPITMLAQFPIVIAVHPSVPAKSVQELVALARSRPGVLNYGTGGVGQQIAFEMLKQALAINIQHIPYKGGAMAVNAAVAGDVQVLALDIGPAVPHLKSGKLRGLAVTSAERSQIVPELPTVAETVSPGFDIILWVGLFAPAATPGSVVATLYKETVNALKFPEIQEKLKGMAMATGGMPSERLSALMKSEFAKIGAIVKAVNIKAE